MKLSDGLQNAFTATLVLCAVVITGLLVRRELLPPRDARAVPPEFVREWRSYASGPHRNGPADAPVTIVEFSDFQCPFCRVLAPRLDSLRAEFPRTVQVVFRHYPLPTHRHAVPAALASECAGQQGRFWPMHDALYRDQTGIGTVPWATFAATAGVPDMDAFDRCMARPEEPRLQADTIAGRELGISGTPTLLVNELKVTGAPPLDSLRLYVRRALAGSSASSRNGG